MRRDQLRIGVIAVVLSLGLGVLSTVHLIVAAGAIAVIAVLLLLAVSRSLPSLVLSALIISGSASLFLDVRFGGISPLGLLTVVFAVGAWGLWLLRPQAPGPLLRAALPFILLCAWSIVPTLLLYHLTIFGLQNLTVVVAFVGLALLAARYSAESPAFATAVGRSLVWSGWIATAIYLGGELLSRTGGSFGTGPRGYAAFALIPLAWYLARWRHGDRAGIIPAAVFVGLIGISLSRTALVSAFVLVALSQFNPRGFKGWLRWIGAALVIAVALYLAVWNIPQLRERFFSGDLSLTIAGIPVNAMGRTKLWQATFDSFLKSPWIGWGAGSVRPVVNAVIPGIDHPHNDYLRVLHDYGIVGFGLWIMGYAALVRRIWLAWRRSVEVNDGFAALHLTAFLSLAGVAMGMLTDNVMAYAFIMAPLAIMVGTSLGRALVTAVVPAVSLSASPAPRLPRAPGSPRRPAWTSPSASPAEPAP